jgi:hypothetical protein
MNKATLANAMVDKSEDSPSLILLNNEFIA